MSNKRRLSNPSSSQAKRQRTHSQTPYLEAEFEMQTMDTDNGPTTSGSHASYIQPSRRGRGIRKGKRGKRLSSRQAQQVRTIMSRRQELKYFPVNAAFATLTNGNSITALLNIPQGDTDSERSGDRLELCGTAELSIMFQNDLTGAGDAGCHYRVIIFQWHPATTPGTSDILLTGASGGVDYTSHYSHDKRQMFTILLDKVFLTWGGAATGNVAVGNVQTNVTNTGLHCIKIPLTGAQKQVQYLGGSSVNGTNQIYMQLLTSSSNTASHLNGWLYTWKVFYRDS